MEIPKEHQVICPLCGFVLDCRDLNQVLSHEWNPLTGACETIPLDTGFSSALKIGDYIEWSGDKQPTNLN